MDLEDFRLTMRHFMINKLNSGEILNLQWMGERKEKFKIPWNKQGQPRWEEEYELFKAWYERKGNSVNGEKWSKLKDQFRNALNKSNDFEEMTEEHRLNQQTGNYKVYRILNPQETLAKTERNRKRKTSQKSGCSPTYSTISGSTTSPLYQGRTFSDDLTPSSGNGYSSSNNLDLMDLIDGVNTDIPSPAQTSVEPNCPNNHDFATVSINGTIMETSPQLTSFQPSITEGPSQPIFPVTILDCVLENYMINKAELPKCAVSLHYRNEPTGKSTFDLSTPRRIFYGLDDHQSLRVAIDKPDSLDHFNKKPIEITKYEGTDEKINFALKFMDQGIALRMDEFGNLFGTRLCQTHVYHFHQSLASTTALKMERNKETLLFSHEAFIEDILAHSNDVRKPLPSNITKLYVGTKPSYRHSCGVVTVTLEPRIAELVSEKYQDKTLNLMFSDPNSLDHVIRKAQSLSLE